MDYKKKYEELYERISNLVRDYDCVSGLIDVREELKSILNESQESEDENVQMIQWKGDNLRKVVEFTGKSPKFNEWFKTWDAYENYVHSHGNIFKLFCEDGNHYEVPVGAWIVKTPDGYNVASKAIFKPKIEQNPTDKVESKFKVGDWIVHNKNIELANSLMLVTDKYDNHYLCKYINGQCSYDIEFIDKYYHLWTIQDAKDGDVLAVDYIIFIYKTTLASHVVSYCRLIGKEFDHFEYARTCNEGNAYVHPATKEQRDLLFHKMKEAGYEWDDETKELKKINLIKAEHGKYYYCIKDYFSGGKKFASKGDVVIALRGLPIMGLEDISEYFLPVTNVQNPTWGEEDERNLSIAIQYVYEHGYFSVVNWLKSLKDRVQPKPKQELSWNEEGEEMFDAIIADIQFTQKAHTHEVNHVVYEREIDWLKSLKERYTWKPSDEQMDALNIFIGEANSYDTAAGYEEAEILGSLYDQLKKLKGE